MRCYRCGNVMRDSRTEFPLDTSKGQVIVTGVPAKECPVCGEVVIHASVFRVLEDIKRQCDLGLVRPVVREHAELAYAAG